MNRRICACGATIVCADLDGLPVWLDNEPVARGLFRVVANDGVNLDAVVDANGTHQRHTCHADPRPVTVDPPEARTDTTAQRVADAAQQDIAAAQTVLSSGVPIGPAQRRAAQLRIAHPELSARQIARNAGIPPDRFAAVLTRLRRHAERIASTGATS